MSDQHDATPAAAHGHDDPMSHVPPPSLWPLLVTVGLVIVPFGVLSILGTLKQFGPLGNWHVGMGLIVVGSGIFIYALMGWCHQIISEKTISHDRQAQQRDLQMFILLFLCGELMAFAAIFGYFFYRHVVDPHFGPPHVEGFHFGGPLVAYATFILLSSSVTCEFAHHALQKHQMNLAKLMFAITILLGVAFLGFQGYEYGELIHRGFYPLSDAIKDTSHSAFSAIFYTSTGFHGLHVMIGLVMLFMVLLRLQAGHFSGDRHFAAVAASWYWHFVDIVWVILFITIYVVA
jgi:cytochrome c oxidase subunit 3